MMGVVGAIRNQVLDKCNGVIAKSVEKRNVQRENMIFSTT